MLGAVIQDNIVQNIIVMDKSQVDELSAALDATIADASEYGLAIGDIYNPIDDTWTRNANGDNFILTKLDPVSYDSFSVAIRRALDAEERANAYAKKLFEGAAE